MPSSSSFRIYIIDEVHMLTMPAFNALLKTLEEPPAHVKFIFATTETHKVPVTILSRCQRFDFKKIPQVQIVGHLDNITKKEDIEISKSGLALIAREADGPWPLGPPSTPVSSGTTSTIALGSPSVSNVSTADTR